MRTIPDWRALLASEKKPKRLLRILLKGVTDEPYLHWDAFERLIPPGKLSREQWWAVVKLGRMSRVQGLALPRSGQGWHYSLIPSVLRLNDLLTRSDLVQGERYVLSAQAREAIYSCRLDGLSLMDDEETRQALRSAMPPVDPARRAGWNLFQVLRMDVKESAPLSPRSLQVLAAQLSEGTADEGTWPGLPDALVDALGPFLDDNAGGCYVPSLVRAVAVYACVRDALSDWPPGGRMSRALFVWSASALGNQVIPTLSWSKVLARAPKKVKRTMKQTVSDEYDLTYFLLHHLETLEVALRERDRRYRRKRLVEAEQPVSGGGNLNERQWAILHRAWRRTETIFTIAVHQAAHGIVYETARTDLLGLVRLGLFCQEKRQRAFVYRLAQRD